MARGEQRVMVWGPGTEAATAGLSTAISTLMFRVMCEEEAELNEQAGQGDGEGTRPACSKPSGDVFRDLTGLEMQIPCEHGEVECYQLPARRGGSVLQARAVLAAALCRLQGKTEPSALVVLYYDLAAEGLLLPSQSAEALYKMVVWAANGLAPAGDAGLPEELSKAPDALRQACGLRFVAKPLSSCPMCNRRLGTAATTGIGPEVFRVARPAAPHMTSRLGVPGDDCSRACAARAERLRPVCRGSSALCRDGRFEEVLVFRNTIGQSCRTSHRDAFMAAAAARHLEACARDGKTSSFACGPRSLCPSSVGATVPPPPPVPVPVPVPPW